MATKYIGLYLSPSAYVTAEQYRQIERAITDRHLLGATTPGDEILARMIYDNAPRYYQVLDEEAASE